MKKILYIFSGSLSNSRSQEALEALLAGSAFTDCAALFREAAVLQLLKNQKLSFLYKKEFSLGYSALLDYGVREIYCSKNAMDRYGILAEDLFIKTEIISSDRERMELDTCDVALNF